MKNKYFHFSIFNLLIINKEVGILRRNTHKKSQYYILSFLA